MTKRQRLNAKWLKKNWYIVIMAFFITLIYINYCVDVTTAIYEHNVKEFEIACNTVDGFCSPPFNFSLIFFIIQQALFFVFILAVVRCPK